MEDVDKVKTVKTLVTIGLIRIFAKGNQKIFHRVIHRNHKRKRDENGIFKIIFIIKRVLQIYG